jgi:hypothetical protein
MSGHHTPLQDAIAKARATRNALAGTVRGALIQLERTPAGSSSDRRAVHEVACLQQALAALIASPPEPKLTGIDAELAAAMRVPLDVALDLAK